jgi:amidase
VSSKQVGCLELLDFFLERIERFNPALNAIVAFEIDKARERAREADRALATARFGAHCTGFR